MSRVGVKFRRQGYFRLMQLVLLISTFQQKGYFASHQLGCSHEAFYAKKKANGITSLFSGNFIISVDDMTYSLFLCL